MSKVLSASEKQARDSYRNQIARCHYKWHPSYKNYGARGIRVLYRREDFIRWWLLSLSKKSWKQPTVGRIDHDGNYCFENIEMQERSDNAKEGHLRESCGRKRIAVLASNRDTGEVLIFPSLTIAAKETGAGLATVYRQCFGRIKSRARKAWMFERLD